MRFLIPIVYVLLAPFVGGLIAGADRKISARMQGRQGPPILQPFYDVMKLFSKESIVVNRVQGFFVVGFLTFIVFTGVLFFSGGDLLLVIFALTLASIFLVIGAYASNSPYSAMGAERELMQMMSYEPMVLITAVGFYMATDSFGVAHIIGQRIPAILYLPGVFLGFVYILTIKLRKSPFDLSTSHHAHQELVKGITTEFSGSTLALMDIAHWYENVFLLGVLALFFIHQPLWSWGLAVGFLMLIYFLEILIDNSFARVKWQTMLRSSWLVAVSLGFINLLILNLLK